MEYNIGKTKNKLIVVEGACDGIGKSTQFQALCDHLKKDGEEVANHHFPSYGTPQGANVERYLRGEFGKPSEIDPKIVHSWYACDRAITWEQVLKPLYEQGQSIVLDRYTTSSIIYQSALFTDEQKKRDFIDYVVDYEYNKLGIKEPDSVIFLHAPFDLVTEIRNARKQNDGVQNDIHERDIEFMRKVYDNAMFVADYLNWDKVRCDDGESLRSIEDIHEDVYKLVRKK
jgi:dTMP kinase